MFATECCFESSIGKTLHSITLLGNHRTIPQWKTLRDYEEKNTDWHYWHQYFPFIYSLIQQIFIKHLQYTITQESGYRVVKKTDMVSALIKHTI